MTSSDENLRERINRVIKQEYVEPKLENQSNIQTMAKPEAYNSTQGSIPSIPRTPIELGMNCELEHFDCCSKSYPSFFRHLMVPGVDSRCILCRAVTKVKSSNGFQKTVISKEEPGKYIDTRVHEYLHRWEESVRQKKGVVIPAKLSQRVHEIIEFDLKRDCERKNPSLREVLLPQGSVRPELSISVPVNPNHGKTAGLEDKVIDQGRGRNSDHQTSAEKGNEKAKESHDETGGFVEHTNIQTIFARELQPFAPFIPPVVLQKAFSEAEIYIRSLDNIKQALKKRAEEEKGKEGSMKW